MVTVFVGVDRSIDKLNVQFLPIKVDQRFEWTIGIPLLNVIANITHNVSRQYKM